MLQPRFEIVRWREPISIAGPLLPPLFLARSKDATRLEKGRVSELYPSLSLWRAECSHVENEEGTIKRYFNNTSSKLPIMVHARDDRPPRAEKLFQRARFLPFFHVTRVLGHISPSWRYEFRRFETAHEIANVLLWRTPQPRPQPRPSKKSRIR